MIFASCEYALILLAILVIENVRFTTENLGYGSNLKCYQCNSHTQPHCADPFDNRTFILEPCPNNGQNYSRCMKKIDEMSYDGTWQRRIERGCAVSGEIGPEEGRWCKTVAGVRLVIVRYCYCDNKHGCNRSSSCCFAPQLLIFCLCLAIRFCKLYFDS